MDTDYEGRSLADVMRGMFLGEDAQASEMPAKAVFTDIKQDVIKQTPSQAAGYVNPVIKPKTEIEEYENMVPKRPVDSAQAAIYDRAMAQSSYGKKMVMLRKYGVGVSGAPTTEDADDFYNILHALNGNPLASMEDSKEPPIVKTKAQPAANTPKNTSSTLGQVKNLLAKKQGGGGVSLAAKAVDKPKPKVDPRAFSEKSQVNSSKEVTSSADTDPAIAAARAQAQAQAEVEMAGLPSQYRYLESLQKSQGVREAEAKKHRGELIKRMDDNARGEFLQGIVHALGQVAAGVTGLATGTDVAKYYKPVEVYKRSAQDAIDKERYGMEEEIDESKFLKDKDSLTLLQKLEKARDMANPQARASAMAQVTKILSDNVNKKQIIKQKDEDFKKGIRPESASSGGGGAEKKDIPKISNIADQYPVKQAHKDAAALMSKLNKIGLDGLVPKGKTIDEQANDYAHKTSIETSIPKDTLIFFYKRIAMEAKQQGKTFTPSQINNYANIDLQRALSFPMDMRNKPSVYWYKRYVKELSDRGIPPVSATPTVKKMFQDSSGGSYTVDYYNPFDERNTESFLNQGGQ